MRMRLLPALLAAIAVAPLTAAAQTAYRCGTDGREYQQAPCPGGQALNVADPRSDAQRREATQLSQREAALAQALSHERQGSGSPALQNDRTASAPQKAHTATPAPKDHPAARRHGKHGHPLAPDERITRAPKADKPKPSKKPAEGEKPHP